MLTKKDVQSVLFTQEVDGFSECLADGLSTKEMVEAYAEESELEQPLPELIEKYQAGKELLKDYKLVQAGPYPIFTGHAHNVFEDAAGNRYEDTALASEYIELPGGYQMGHELERKVALVKRSKSK